MISLIVASQGDRAPRSREVESSKTVESDQDKVSAEAPKPESPKPAVARPSERVTPDSTGLAMEIKNAAEAALTQCSLCGSVLINPRLLPCLHSFCCAALVPVSGLYSRALLGRHGPAHTISLPS